MKGGRKGEKGGGEGGKEGGREGGREGRKGGREDSVYPSQELDMSIPTTTLLISNSVRQMCYHGDVTMQSGFGYH